MRIYLASSFGLIPQVAFLADWLERQGFEVAVKWWAKDGFGVYSEETHRETCTDVDPEDFYTRETVRAIFDRDSSGVRGCDAFVFVAGPSPRKFNGANVELGIAIALGKPCYSIGRLENCALYVPITRCKGLTELAGYLRAQARGRS